MKKFIISFAAMAALAIVPSSALAQPVGPWGGYSNPHCDNLASTSPPYILSTGTGPSGNSHYYVDPKSSSPYPACSTEQSDGAIDTTIYSTGYLNGPGGGCLAGCGHGASPGSIGGLYVGSSALKGTPGLVAGADGQSAGVGVAGN